MKKLTKLDILKLAENTNEGISEEEIAELYQNDQNFKSSYRSFYNDVKTNISEDW